MEKTNLNTVRVKFADSAHDYTTSVSAQTDEAAARKYFVGKYFNVGSFRYDNMQQCIDIEYTKNDSDAIS